MTHEQAVELFETLWLFTRDRGEENRTFTRALRVAFPKFPICLPVADGKCYYEKEARSAAKFLREWASALEDLKAE